MTRPELCVGAIAIIDGEILLVKRANPPEAGKWSIPGGHVLVNESLERAVERELYEETGLRGKCKLFVGSGEIITDKSHKVILDFEVLIEGDTRPSPASDASDCKWTPLKEVESMLLADGLKIFLHDNGYL